MLESMRLDGLKLMAREDELQLPNGPKGETEGAIQDLTVSQNRTSVAADVPTSCSPAAFSITIILRVHFFRIRCSAILPFGCSNSG